MKVDLNGNWLMKKSTDDKFISSIVPGSVYADLMREGIMGDPFWRDNEKEAVEFSQFDYTYMRTFLVSDEFFKNEYIELICDGIDTDAQIFINDVKVAYTNNMHRKWVFDIIEFLKIGENSIRIELASPLKTAREMYVKFPTPDVGACTNGFTGIRKAHCMYGWDWGGRFTDFGIWRNIYLFAYNGAIFDSVYINQQHSENRVDLSIDYTLKGNGDNYFEIEVLATAPDGIVNKQNEEGRIVINNPLLWWPNGYGKQPLYNVSVLLKKNGEIIDEWQRRIGLRTITISQKKDEWGESFAHSVNKTEIFAMGACYIPEDIILSNSNEERTRRLLTDFASCNANVIRVWGGAFFPDDYFFDICDELGMIVWQDFMFACGFYNLTDDFEENITAEMIDNIKRIRHHACLGLWCGNNEVEWFAMENWQGPTSLQKSDYIKLMEYIIPKILKKLDPQTFYWPSSPSSGGGFDKPNSDDCGDTHFWRVWSGELFFTEYRKYYFRYLSEFGFQSLPHEKTIESFSLPEDRNLFSYIMEKHQRSTVGSYRIINNICKLYPMPFNFSDLLYASQLSQAETLKYCVEHLRRNRGRCMGALYWQLNDCWPVLSWSTIDYYGRWKAAQYFSKHFFAPILLSADVETALTQNMDINAQPYEMKKSAVFHISNETFSAFSGKIKWFLCDNCGNVLRKDEHMANVKPLSVYAMEKIDFKEADIYCDFVRYELYDMSENLMSAQSILFCEPKYFRFLKPEIDCLIDGKTIKLTCKGFAKNVEVITEDADELLTDNYFDLFNESKTISVIRGNVENIRIRSVFDIGK
jgi:beta-mannosidase